MIAKLSMVESSATEVPRSVGMGTTLGAAPIAFQRHRRVSPFARLAEEWGLAKEKTARDQLSNAYRRVAIANRVLLEAGLSEKVGELMAVVEASLMGEPLPLDTAIHAHNRCDAAEDLAQAEFIKNAGDAELAAWIKKLADDLFNGERLLQALITEQHARKEAK